MFDVHRDDVVLGGMNPALARDTHTSANSKHRRRNAAMFFLGLGEKGKVERLGPVGDWSYAVEFGRFAIVN